MSFASVPFFVFFTIVLVVCALTGHCKRQWFLLAASYVFYGWWDARFCALMLFLTVMGYWSAIGSEKTGARIYAVMGIAAPLVVLGFFKYFNFFVSSFAVAFGIEHAHTLHIILPVGISFYTFQVLSYTIDVRMGKIRAERSFRKLALYIAFFPQLVAGPIIKAKDFLPQLDEERGVTRQNLLTGVQIFAFGLFKKVVLADSLSVFVDDVFATPNAFSGFSLFLGVLAYSMQIYFDFSGYSDMATGCAKCLGYDFIRNFNLPYSSRNISEFWHRWHISLSTWLKEYLYIPLGGNRRGNARTYLNLFLTMLLGGLWHGAAWTFVAWGALHGAGLCVHKYFAKRFKVAAPNFLFIAASVLFTNLFVGFCWIFFRASSFQTAWDYIRGILTWQDGVSQPYIWAVIALVLLGVATLCAALKSRGKKAIDGFYPVLDLSRFWPLVGFIVFLGIIFGLAYTGANPFIYFQF
jgi:alginate O-acetyltransferase complex protein AlgI